MVLITTDGLGNYFAGAITRGKFSPFVPDLVFTKSTFTIDNLSEVLTDLCVVSGLQFRSIVSQSVIDNDTANRLLVSFSPVSDIIDDRFVFSYGRFYAGWNSPSGIGLCGLYNDSGNTATITPSATNGLVFVGNYPNSLSLTFGGQRSFLFQQNGDLATHSPVYVTATATNKSLALFLFQTRLVDGFVNTVFYYGGKMNDVPVYVPPYYTAEEYYQDVIMCNDNQGFFASSSVVAHCHHYIGTTKKKTLILNDGDFNIVCDPPEAVTSRWDTKAWLFEENALNIPPNPTMGNCDNLLLSTGLNDALDVFQIGSGGASPPIGNNLWLPVGKYTANKMLSMRCS